MVKLGIRKLAGLSLLLTMLVSGRLVAGQEQPTLTQQPAASSTPCTISFADVTGSHWAYQYITSLACGGIVNGIGGGNFGPENNATRIQFAKMITLARGWSLLNPATPSFSDVLGSHILYRYVETAKANGVINGYSGTACTGRGVQSPCYLPDDNISRAQTALIIVRAYDWPTNTEGGPHFSDVTSNSFFYNAVETAYNRGTVSGVGGGRFDPDANVTRAQISKMLKLGLDQPAPAPSPITAADYNAIKMTSANQGWIVGNGGAIRRYANGGWSNYPSPVTANLRAVDGNAFEAWAVGDNNTILHRTTGAWQPVSSPLSATTQLLDVDVVSGGQAWILSLVYTNTFPALARSVLLHYDSSRWVEVPTPLPADYHLLQMDWVGPDDGWLVGSDMPEFGRSVVYHYTAGSWTQVTIPYTQLAISIDMLNGGEGWVGVDDADYERAMLHYSAGIWTVIRDSDAGAISDEAQKPTGNCGYRQAYRAVRSFASNDYYAGVEQYGICLPHEYSFRHNIHSYGVHLPNPIYGMDGAATDDLWIVGAGGGIYHWDGSTVTQVH